MKAAVTIVSTPVGKKYMRERTRSVRALRSLRVVIVFLAVVWGTGILGGALAWAPIETCVSRNCAPEAECCMQVVDRGAVITSGCTCADTCLQNCSAQICLCPEDRVRGCARATGYVQVALL